MLTRNLLLASFCGFLIPVMCTGQVPKKITVEAGRFDRQNTIVSFTVPTGYLNYQLSSDDGSKGDLQIEGTQACFILDNLKAGKSRSYLVTSVPEDSIPMILLAQDGNSLKATAPGHEILQYNGGRTPLPEGIEPIYQRGGYIHPVYTPSGKLLTDDYAPDHKHHHGIWSPWTKTEYEGRHPDFWNMGGGTGRVEFESLGKPFFGQVFGGFRAHHQFVDMTATPEKIALNEVWDLTVYPPVSGKKPYFVFDLMTTQNVVDSPLTLPKYLYGGLGFRGRREWKGKDGMTFLTSEGKDRTNGNETCGRWCWAGGRADGETIGITIMNHPGNFRSPQPMRLHPDQPFFCYAPSQMGDWKIEKGKPYVARYRFVTTDGAADAAEINRLWNDYAEPPKVTIE